MGLLACNNCDRLKEEKYQIDLITDSVFVSSIHRLFSNLSEPDLTNANFESYRLLVLSPVENGTKGIIILSKTENGCILKTINFGRRNIGDSTIAYIKDTSIKVMPKEKWLAFEDLIYASKYWTLLRCEESNSIEGIGYFLEASRPQARLCNKRTHQIVLRQAPAKDDLFSFVCELLLFNSTLK